MNDDRASASAPESDTRVLDIDPEETAEWCESLDAVVGVHGAARGEQLVRSAGRQEARMHGIRASSGVSGRQEASSALIASAAVRSRGTARSPKASSTRETGPDTDTAVGVGASGTAIEKQRTPISCS